MKGARAPEAAISILMSQLASTAQVVSGQSEGPAGAFQQTLSAVSTSVDAVSDILSPTRGAGHGNKATEERKNDGPAAPEPDMQAISRQAYPLTAQTPVGNSPLTASQGQSGANAFTATGRAASGQTSVESAPVTLPPAHQTDAAPSVQTRSPKSAQSAASQVSLQPASDIPVFHSRSRPAAPESTGKSPGSAAGLQPSSDQPVPARHDSPTSSAPFVVPARPEMPGASPAQAAGPVQPQPAAGAQAAKPSDALASEAVQSQPAEQLPPTGGAPSALAPQPQQRRPFIARRPASAGDAPRSADVSPGRALASPAVSSQAPAKSPEPASGAPEGGSALPKGPPQPEQPPAQPESGASAGEASRVKAVDTSGSSAAQAASTPVREQPISSAASADRHTRSASDARKASAGGTAAPMTVEDAKASPPSMPPSSAPLHESVSVRLSTGGKSAQDDAARGKDSQQPDILSSPDSVQAAPPLHAAHDASALPDTAPAASQKARASDAWHAIEQVARAADAASHRGPANLTVRLDPPDLGVLHVKVSLTQQGLQAHVRAESPETRQMLWAHQNDLRDALQQVGLKLDRLSVPDFSASFGSFDQGRGAFQWQQQSHGQPHSLAAPAVPAAMPEARASSSLQSPLHASALVDSFA